MWFSMWSDKSPVHQDLHGIMRSLDWIWTNNGSVSLYMIHGGSNFGFWNGAETDGPVSQNKNNFFVCKKDKLRSSLRTIIRHQSTKRDRSPHFTCRYVIGLSKYQTGRTNQREFRKTERFFRIGCC